MLVILGLLVGGILAGQSLIRASELRSINTEYQRWNTALYAFRDKYFAIPGDFADATRVWQRQSSAAACVTNSGASVSATGVCDGNSDGVMNAATGSSLPGEFTQLWRQLAAAGLIEGSYSGYAGSAGNVNTSIGTNVPASKLSAAGWNMRSIGGSAVYTGDSDAFQLVYANAYQFGAQSSGYGVSERVLIPAEAWNIDQKIDDGKATYGRLVAYGMSCVTPISGANTSSNLNQDYKLSDTSVQCGLLFPKAI